MNRPNIYCFCWILACSIALWASTENNAASEQILKNHDQQVSAELIADQDQFHLIFNQHQLEYLGAWQAYFDLGLETGLNENIAGLGHADFKIDSAELFRYAPTFDKGWEKVSNCTQELIGESLVVHIPRSHLALPHKTLRWRVVLFPHESDRPLFSPAEPGELKLSQSIPWTWAKSESFSFNAALALLTHPKTYPWKSANWSHSPYPSQVPEETSFEAKLQAPWPNTLWWPNTSGNIFEVIQQDRQRANRMPSDPRNIVFSRPDLSDEEIQWVNRVRAWSCHRMEQKSAFIIDRAAEIPPEADAILVNWRPDADLEERIRQLESIRKIYSGPIYTSMEELNTRRALEKSMSLETWLRFKALPLLPLDCTLKEVEHTKIASVIWTHILIKNQADQWTKLPVQINLNEYPKLLQQSPEHYLHRINKDLNDLYSHL